MRRVALDLVDFRRHDIAKLLIAIVAGGGDGTGRDGCCSQIVVAQVGLEGFGALADGQLPPAGSGEPAAVIELGDPAARRTKLCAAAHNLLRLHRLSLSPYGDGVQGATVLRDAPPRG